MNWLNQIHHDLKEQAEKDSILLNKCVQRLVHDHEPKQWKSTARSVQDEMEIPNLELSYSRWLYSTRQYAPEKRSSEIHLKCSVPRLKTEIKGPQAENGTVTYIYLHFIKSMWHSETFMQLTTELKMRQKKKVRTERKISKSIATLENTNTILINWWNKQTENYHHQPS